MGIILGMDYQLFIKKMQGSSPSRNTWVFR